MAKKQIGDDPFIKDDEFQHIEEDLEMYEDLWGGTKSMREAGRTYLPQYEAEEPTSYDNRLSRATLLNVFKETVEFLTGRVFQKPVVLKEAHDDLMKFLENVDLEGNDWSVFLYEVFKHGLRDGSVNVFVDYPERSSETPTSQADVKKMGLRPYWVMWKQNQIYGVRAQTVGSQEHISQVRVHEVVQSDVGMFGKEDVPQIRVYTPGNCEVYQKKTQGRREEIIKVSSMNITDRSGKPLAVVPVSTFYTGRKSVMCGVSTLVDLAYKNVEHYQLYSDYRNCLTVTLFPILCITGYQEQTKPGPSGSRSQQSRITLGPLNFIKLTDPQSKVYYAEHNGNSLGQAVKQLSNLKEEMAMYGLRPLIPQPGQKTATGEAIDEAREISELQAQTYRFRDFVERVLYHTAVWLGLDPETAVGEVEVNEDLTISARDVREIDALRAAREKGDISRQTFLEELKRRGVLSDRFDIEDEIQRLAEEFASSPGLEDLIGQFGATGGEPPTPPEEDFTE